MKIFIQLILVSIAFLGSISAQEKSIQITLEQLLEMAKNNALAHDEALLNMQEAELNFKLYKANLKPQVTASANLPNYSKTFSEIVQPDGTVLFQPVTNNNSSIAVSMIKNISATGGALFAQSSLQRFDDFENKAHLYNGNPIRIGIYQPLLSFNPLKWDKKIQPLMLEEAKLKFSTQVEDIYGQATNLFTQLLIIHQELEIAKANVLSNEALYNIAQEKFALGKIAKVDLMNLQLEFISAQKDQKKALQSLAQTTAEIYAFLGKEYGGELFLPQLPTTKRGDKINRDLAVKEARANRPESKLLERNILEADLEVEKAQKNGGLNVDLQASIGWVRSSKEVAQIYQDPQLEQFAEVQLSIPIVDWGKQKSQVGLSKAKRDFVQKSVAQQTINFKTEVTQWVAQFNFLIEELQMMEEIREVAEQRFQIAKESYLLGAIDLTSLSIAQQEQSNALRAYTFTLSEYLNTYYLIRRLTLYDFQNNKKIIHL